jgi:hypothetical protein
MLFNVTATGCMTSEKSAINLVTILPAVSYIDIHRYLAALNLMILAPESRTLAREKQNEPTDFDRPSHGRRFTSLRRPFAFFAAHQDVTLFTDRRLHV